VRLTAAAVGTAGFAAAAGGRAVGTPALVGLAGRVGVSAEPAALDDVGAAAAGAEVVGPEVPGAVADERIGAATGAGRAAADRVTGARAAVAAPGEEVGFAVAALLAAACGDTSAMPAGFRAATAPGVSTDAAGVDPGERAAVADPGALPEPVEAVGSEARAEPAGMAESAVRNEPVGVAGSADLAEPGAAKPGERAEPVDAAESAGRAEPVEAAGSAGRVEPVDAAEPPAGAANAEGIVASFGPKSVASNRGEAQVPEYAESTRVVAHEPGDDVLDASVAVDDGSDAVLAFVALVVAPALGDEAATGLFAPEGTAFAPATGDAPDALADAAALPFWPAAPGRMGGIPNPAGETGFCGSPDRALVLAVR
jgi:hypothetical protein